MEFGVTTVVAVSIEDPHELLELFHATATAVGAALAGITDWGPSGRRDGQYAADLVADAVALDYLRAAGVGILSEESGTEHVGRRIVVIVDPLDGSTNASRGVPWYATSLCAFDEEGPLAALVVNQARGTRYSAIRGEGAQRDSVPFTCSSTCTTLAEGFIGLSGYPARPFGWDQFRTLGAGALDLCLVAEGTLDGFVDCVSGHGVWDYAGAWLVCHEAGALMVDGLGRELIMRDYAARRAPVAAATPELLDALLEARRRSVLAT